MGGDKREIAHFHNPEVEYYNKFIKNIYSEQTLSDSTVYMICISPGTVLSWLLGGLVKKILVICNGQCKSL